MKKVILQVEGMHCSGCENRIENVLKNLEGIQEIHASHEQGTVEVTIEKEEQLEQVKEKITDLGFTVKE